jgi:hypothetical protein
MSRPSQISSPLQSVDEDSFTPGYVVAENDADNDEEANVRTFFATPEPDGVSGHTCLALEEIIADAKNLALIQRLHRFNNSSHLTVKQRTRLGEDMVEDAVPGAYKVQVVDGEGIQELIDKPPTSKTETSAFHKIAPNDWMQLMRAEKSSSGQLSGSGSIQGTVGNTSCIAGARRKMSAMSIPGTAHPPAFQTTRATTANSVLRMGASVATSVGKTASSKSTRQAEVEVDMEDAELGTLDGESHAAIVGGDPMDIDSDSDVTMTGV